MNTIQAKLSSQEIDRRVREIRGCWNDSERDMRKATGEARCETLMSILVGFEEVA